MDTVLLMKAQDRVQRTIQGGRRGRSVEGSGARRECTRAVQRPFSYPVAVSLSQSEPALLFWM